MTDEEMIQYEDIMISIVSNSKKLWQESKNALYDYEQEGLVIPYKVADRCALLSKHIEKLKPYLIAIQDGEI